MEYLLGIILVFATLPLTLAIGEYIMKTIRRFYLLNLVRNKRK